MPGQLSFLQRALTQFPFWYCLFEENQESLQTDQSSSSCNLPLTLNSVIPTSTSPHITALALPSPSTPITSHPWAPDTEVSCYPLGFTQTMVPPLPRSPTWATPIAEVLHKNHSRIPCYLLAHSMVLSCSRQKPWQGLRRKWVQRWGPCAERPWHTEQAFLLSLSHTTACKCLQMKCVHASPVQHPSRHGN